MLMLPVFDLVKEAASHLGKTRTAVAKDMNLKDPGPIKWCGWFVRMCGSRYGISFGSSNTSSQLTAPNGVYEFKCGTPRIGDVLFIQPKNENGISHVGLCEKVENGIIYSIEGNMTGSVDNSTVRRASYNRDTGDGGSWGKILKFGATLEF